MLEGKVAIVTGAGRGIGRAIALLMAARGARVIVNDVGASVEGEGADTSPADEVVAAIRAEGGEAAVSRDSVVEWTGAQRIVGAALNSFGRIDVVVNNAGILRDRIFHTMGPADWNAVVGLHLNGRINCRRAAAKNFPASRSGGIVPITSTSVLYGHLWTADSAAAKP